MGNGSFPHTANYCLLIRLSEMPSMFGVIQIRGISSQALSLTTPTLDIVYLFLEAELEAFIIAIYGIAALLYLFGKQCVLGEIKFANPELGEMRSHPVMVRQALYVDSMMAKLVL